MPIKTLNGSVTAALNLAVVVAIAACAPAPALSPARTSNAITAADAKLRIYQIADDSMKGREAGGIGNVMMTNLVEREVRRLGLEPGGDSGTYFQVIPMVRRFVDSASTLSVGGKSFALYSEFAPTRPSNTVRTGTELKGMFSVVFGGRAGDSINSLSAEAAAGKIVVLDAPLGADGKPTGVYTVPMALAVSRYPHAAGIVIAALDLVTPAAANGLRARGSGLSTQHPGEVARPIGIVVTPAVAEALAGGSLSALTPGATGQSVVGNIFSPSDRLMLRQEMSLQSFADLIPF